MCCFNKCDDILIPTLCVVYADMMHVNTDMCHLHRCSDIDTDNELFQINVLCQHTSKHKIKILLCYEKCMLEMAKNDIV